VNVIEEVYNTSHKGISEDYFSFISSHMPLLSQLLRLLHTGGREIWGSKRELSGNKKNIKMSSFTPWRIRSFKMNRRILNDHI
jgi:hypothetical protein